RNSDCPQRIVVTWCALRTKMKTYSYFWPMALIVLNVRERKPLDYTGHMAGGSGSCLALSASPACRSGFPIRWPRQHHRQPEDCHEIEPPSTPLDCEANALGPRWRWRAFLDTYRTLCLAPTPEIREIFEQLRSSLARRAVGIKRSERTSRAAS